MSTRLWRQIYFTYVTHFRGGRLRGGDKRYGAERGLYQRDAIVEVLLFQRKFLHHFLLKLSTQRINKLTKRNCEV